MKASETWEIQISCLKSTLLFVAIFIAALDSFAEVIPLEQHGYQFYSKTMAVEWKVPTNQLPATARAFRVVPTKFSHTLVSNLISWGGFSETNRIWLMEDGSRIPYDILVYRKNNDRQSLVVNPPEGTAEFYNTISFRSDSDEAPDKPRAYALGTNILRQLGVATNEMILEDGKPKAWFYEGDTTTHPKGRGPITFRSSMGVEFRRQLDEISCIWEDIHVDFEPHEQIQRIEIRWHGLKPSKPYPVAKPEQISAWIKEGRARVQSFEGPIGARWMHTADIKRLTILGASPRYTAATSLFGDKDKLAERLYPFVDLRADAEMAPDDHETIWLRCPIIAEGLNPPSQASTNDIGFSVFPSNLREMQRKQSDER